MLPRLAPRAAAELYLTGDVFDGARAAEIGLVTAAVPADELDAAVARYCAALVRGAPLALAGDEAAAAPAAAAADPGGARRAVRPARPATSGPPRAARASPRSGRNVRRLGPVPVTGGARS